jgi:hypothetical protein
MNRGHHVALWIMNQHRHTVRRPHRHHHPRLVRHQGIPPSLESIVRREGPINDQRIGPMNLFDGEKPGGPRHTGPPLNRDSDFNGQARGMATGAEKVTDPALRRRERRNSDDRRTHHGASPRNGIGIMAGA